MRAYKQPTSCLFLVAVLAIVSGCEVEPEFWEMETYVAQGKPEGIEYMFCGLGSKLVEVNVDEGTAEVIDVSKTDTVAVSMIGYDELPEPGYVEERLTISKAYAGLYRTSIVVTEIKIEGCAFPKRLNATVSLAFNEESKIWRLEQETEAKVYIEKKERLNTHCQWQYIQSTMEDSIPFSKRDYSHSCKFMPDTHSFKTVLNEQRKRSLEHAEKHKAKTLARLQAELQRAADKEREMNAAGKDRI